MSEDKDTKSEQAIETQEEQEEKRSRKDVAKAVESAIDLLVAQFDEKLSIESAAVVGEPTETTASDKSDLNRQQKDLAKKWIDAREFVLHRLDTRHDSNVVLCGFLARNHICDAIDNTQICKAPQVTESGYTSFRLDDWYTLLDLVVQCDQGARAVSIMEEIHRIELSADAKLVKEHTDDDANNENGSASRKSDTVWSTRLQSIFDDIVEHADHDNNLNLCRHVLMSESCRSKLSAAQLNKVTQLLHHFLSNILRKESHDGILVYRNPATVKKWLDSLSGATFTTMIQAVEFMEEFRKRQRVVHGNKVQLQAKRAKTGVDKAENAQENGNRMDQLAHALVAREYPEFQLMVETNSLIGAETLLQVCHDRRMLEHEAILEHLVPMMSSYRNLNNTASEYLTQKEAQLRLEAKALLNNNAVAQAVGDDDSDADVADKLPKSVAGEKIARADEIKKQLSEMTRRYEQIRNSSKDGIETNTPENLESLRAVELNDTQLCEQDIDLQSQTVALAQKIMELMAKYIDLRNRQSVVRARRINVVKDAKKSFKNAEADEYHKRLKEECANLTAESYFAD